MNVVTIDAPTELTLPPADRARWVGARAGASDAIFDQVQFWATRGVFVVDIAGDRSEIKAPRAYFGLDSLDAWCSLGSEVTDYDIYHEIDDVTKRCPYSTSGETWAQWGLGPGGGHAPIEIDGRWYRSNRYGAAGERLPASQWYRYLATPQTAVTGIQRIMTVEDFLQIQQQASP